MTVLSQPQTWTTIAAVSGVTRYTIPFRVDAQEDVRVTHETSTGVRTDLVLGTDYRVTNLGKPTATLVLNVARPTGDYLHVRRHTLAVQPVDLAPAAPLSAEEIEAALDRGALIAQDIREVLERVPQAAFPGGPRGLVLPQPTAGQAIGWNSAGQLVNVPARTERELTLVPQAVGVNPAVPVPVGGHVLAAAADGLSLEWVPQASGGGGGGGGIPDVPSDGVAYVRRNASWVSADARYVALLPSAAAIPAGTTAQRPASPPTGATRWNTETGLVEVYGGTSWIGIGAGGEDQLRWADTAADLGGGSGFVWPGLYRRTGPNTWAFEPRLNPGLVYRHLPEPGGGGPVNADPWSPVHVFGSAVAHTSLSAPNLDLNAGKVVIVVFTAHGSAAPAVSSITHPALSNVTTPDGRPTLDHSSWKGRVTVVQADCAGGTGTLTINLATESWVTICHVRQVAADKIGAFLGAAQSSHVTGVPSVSVSRTGGNPKVDLALVHGVNSVEGAVFNVSRDEASLQRGNISPWVRAASTSGANDIDDVLQTFSISSGNIAAGRAVILQWAGPSGSGGSADYTVTPDDLSKKLICHPGTTNVTLPVLSLPHGSDANGQIGVECFLAIEVPPNSVLNLIRGAGASFWTGPNSGNVASARVTSSATQRKLLGLITRHDGLWQIVSGEVD
jgi:hypothetical protein